MNAFLRRSCALVGAVVMLAATTAAQDPPREERRQDRQPGRRMAERPGEDRAGPARGEVTPEQLQQIEFEVVRLQHVAAPSLEAALRQMLPLPGRPFQVATMQSTNSLLIAGDKEWTLPTVHKLIEQLDRPAREMGGEPRAEIVLQVLRLEHADVRDLFRTVDELLESRGRRVKTAADVRSNTILLSGDPGSVEYGASIVRQLDELTGNADPNRSGRRGLHFYVLEHAHAADLAQTINNVLVTMRLEARVVGDAPSRTLVAHVTEDESAAIAQMVEKLDRAAVDEPKDKAAED